MFAKWKVKEGDHLPHFYVFSIEGGPCIEKSVLSTQFPANAICANKDGTKIAIAGRKSMSC